ncbi:RNA polymerase [Kitasatospora sp. MMS16-BH015]|uniref:SigE family RNA polymerase sigma factor n=1 Tax=Kitasatospora sp. MMS16-BH015 TaxID=2018025 RepID=UPI000CA26E63|nr:SigE family RNA polymerase sigma factor [Kitasatospora sp. MMS16-BH015]AUG77773.1 RNA polymerase [Kitasatospora sp. MMS16-BH015]
MERDEGEIQAFVAARQQALYRSAYLLCGDRHEAEDLVQATLVKVILGWRRLKGLDNVDAYARRTMVNTFISSRRRFWRREQAFAEVPEVVAAEHDAVVGFAVRAALAALPVKQRAVLVLRYWEDLSVATTADLLKMPESTVRSHAARGIATLRKVLPRDSHEFQGEWA